MNKQRKRGFSVKHEGRILIKQKMQDKGYDDRKLMEVTDLSIDTINDLFRGENKERKTIEAVARALEIDLTDLVNASEWYPQVENTAKDDTKINWLQVSHKMLENQQEQQRTRRKASEMGYEVNVHVPLGLVERKQQQRRNGNVGRKEIYLLESQVITKTYQHQDFLQEIINKGYQGKNRHIAIVGEPGAGKTTLLNAIASDIKDKNQQLPIFISLGSLQDMTLADYILKKWLPDAIRFVPTSEIEAQLQTEFDQGNFYLLLDGVDEMGASSPIQALNKISQELTSWLGQARVILTCRLNVWDATVNNNILPRFNTFKTQEFKPEQVNTFIAEWFQVANNISGGKKLIAQLQKRDKERIRDLVNNPLRLCLLCQIFHRNDQGELPETKGQFYEIFTRYFYEWKPELVPDLIKSYELREKLHQALGNLALAGINSNVRFRLKRSFAVKVIGDEQLFNLACEVGWLNQVDRDAVNDEDVYAFFHPNFQEYFASLVIDDWHYFLNHVPNNPDTGTYRFFETKWKEVIILWMERMKTDALNVTKNIDFVNYVDNFKDNCGGFYEQKASKIIGNIIDLLGNSTIRIEEIHKLIDELIYENLSSSQSNASTDSLNLEQISEQNLDIEQTTLLPNSDISSGKELDHLIELLNDPDINNRRMAAENSIGTIIDVMESICSEHEYEADQDYYSSDYNMFPKIVWAVEKLRNIQNYDYSLLVSNAIKNIKTNQNWYIRIELLKMLQEIGVASSEFIQLLNYLIKSDDDTLVRAKSAYILGKIEPGNKIVIETLENLLREMLNRISIGQHNILEAEIAKELLELDSNNGTALKVLIYLICVSAQIVANSSYPFECLLEALEYNIDKLVKLSHNHVTIKVDESRQHFWFLCTLSFPENHQKLIVRYISYSEGIYHTHILDRDTNVYIPLIKEIFEGNLNMAYQQFSRWFQEHQKWEETLSQWSENAHEEWKKNEELQGKEFLGFTFSYFDSIGTDEYQKFIVYNQPSSSIAYEICRQFLECCAQNMTYPEFYRAWHGEPSPIQNLENQFTDTHSHLSQLEPTEKTYPITLNLKTLQNETDIIEISQEICNQIYFTACPENPEIPQVNNAPQLKSKIPQIKKHLQTENLALIINNCEPNQEMIKFCNKLTDVLHIAFITEQPLDPPLKGFPNQSNLLNVIQHWINEIG